MSLSGSSGEDEQITIMEAQRADHSPPRKKRRLNDSRSQAQQFDDSSSESTNDDLSDSDHDEKSTSDKENVLNGINHKKRRRSSTQQIVSNSNNLKRHRNGKQRRCSSQTQNVYDFGAIAVSPGAIIRLELINFLCHSNFSISFHPSINIIYGQNGSGKSAIEAGISMALGINAKKTGRGNKITDVIRFGSDFAMIKLFLHNQGPEALPEYGKEIVIERKLSRTGKNGASYFRVLDSNLKCKGKGLKAVRNIVDKFSMNVDNPCVVLKQSTAKEFLNSTKSTDKFKFFMQASKLSNYQEEYQEARENIIIAKEQQKQTKGSFVVIRDQYFECKQQYDTLINNEKQCEKIKFWKRAEKWMKYHREENTLKTHQRKINETETRIIKSKKQLNEMRENMSNKMERAKNVKQEIETKAADLNKYMKPINEYKKIMSDLDKERKDAVRKASSKQTFIDRSSKKIKAFQKEHKKCMEQLENDEKGRKLATIQQRLTESTNKLNQYRSERETLERKTEPSIEMKDNEQKLNARKSELYYKQNEIKETKDNLRGLHQQNRRAEAFNDPRIKKKHITIEQIRCELQRYHRRFNRAPIGPLGEYVQMKACNDSDTMNRNIQIVQSVLSSSLCAFLVDSSSDQQLFKQIMWNKWRITVPCIQYRYSDRMDNIPYNPFADYRPNDSDGPLIRVSDMFSIRDSNPWIYNAMITLCSPERVFAHGTLEVARQFVSSRNQAELMRINSILTYRENNNKLYSVAKRGGTVSGQPQRTTYPILQSDTTQAKAWYDNELKKQLNEERILNDNINELKVWVQQSQQQIRSFQQQFKRLNNNIKSLENQIERLSREQTEIQEEQEDDNEIQQHMQELVNSIEDEQSSINQLTEEIAPFKQKAEALLIQLSSNKRKLQEIEQELHDKKREVHSRKRNMNEMLESLQNDKRMIARVPLKISQYEDQLKNDKEVFDDEEKRINGIHEEAKKMGDEVRKENYPQNVKNRNRVFSLRELKQTRCRLEAEIEEWQNAGNDADDIRQRFASIKPKYEQHQSRVDQCNHNVDETWRLLRDRRKKFDKMKIEVQEQLSKEFRIIMRQQGHDGKLIVNYETKELEMKVHMASHDGLTQVVNSKTLSGGERSFTQVALIMALQKFSGSPMCIYDEFDVFMDSVNRGNSIKILLKAALLGTGNNKSDSKKQTSTERQYIFITPNDVSPIIAQGHKNMISIHKLQPPRR